MRVPILGISGKWHFGASLVARHKIYYKGEGDGFPPSPIFDESCESMFVHDSSVHKSYSNFALANLLFGLCKFVWVIDLLVNLPSPHPRAPTCPSTPKVLWAKERALTPSPSIVFIFGFIVESIKELGGASYSLLLLFFKINVIDVNIVEFIPMNVHL